MRDLFSVNVGHALQNLFHVALDVLDGDAPIVFTHIYRATVCFAKLLYSLFRILNDLLEILAAVFKDEVLGCLAILTPRIINVKHPDNILTIFELIQYFEFSRHILARFLSPFHSDSLLGVLVIGLKNVTCRAIDGVRQAGGGE